MIALLKAQVANSCGWSSLSDGQNGACRARWRAQRRDLVRCCKDEVAHPNRCVDGHETTAERPTAHIVLVDPVVEHKFDWNRLVDGMELK